MIQLTPAKKRQFVNSLKAYRKKYLSGKYAEVDESATRLMVNEFLNGVLGYAMFDEIKTEYRIRGTYADYIVQIGGKQHFIVEVKSRSIEISDKHLRQAVNYAANEGIDWIVLTNGRQYALYKVLFNKPIESRKVFSVDLADLAELKAGVDCLQYLSRALVAKRGLDVFWNKFSSLDAANLARLLYSPKIVNFLKRELTRTYKTRFSETDIQEAIKNIIECRVENVKPLRATRIRRKRARLEQQKKAAAVVMAPEAEMSDKGKTLIENKAIPTA